MRPVAEPRRWYEHSRFPREDFLRLAQGEVTAAIVRTLRARQRTKNSLLLEGIRRIVQSRRGSKGLPVIDTAAKILADVQAEHPAVAAEILTSPQFGSWAAECLFRLKGLLHTGRDDARRPLPSSLDYIATVAAAAAMRVGYACDLKVPLRDGSVLFPTVGTVHLGARGWARAVLSDSALVVSSGSRAITVPLGPDHRPDESDAWTPIPRLRAQVDGLAIDVSIEAHDPLVNRYAAPVGPFTSHEHSLWQVRLAEAWKILALYHRQTAEAIATGLTTIVPLTEHRPRQSISATSGWAWGAVALSLPPDPVSFAETLVHEYYHLVLSALEDVVTLIGDVDSQLYYAPWRDDARLLPELLQGCYAHLGVVDFWRCQRKSGSHKTRQRSHVEFARRSSSTFEVAKTLASSTAMSNAGRAFTAGMRDRLAEWQLEPVPNQARLLASELALEHRLRWRLTHLCLDAPFADELARAWLDRAAGPPDLAHPPITVTRPSHLLPTKRGRLLELRYRNPSGFRRSLPAETGLDEADVALLYGDYVTASSLYLRRIQSDSDLDAWVGLILVKHRTAPVPEIRLLLERPEIIVALHRRLHALHGIAPDPEDLVAWLSRRQGPAQWAQHLMP